MRRGWRHVQGIEEGREYRLSQSGEVMAGPIEYGGDGRGEKAGSLNENILSIGVSTTLLMYLRIYFNEMR